MSTQMTPEAVQLLKTIADNLTKVLSGYVMEPAAAPKKEPEKPARKRPVAPDTVAEFEKWFFTCAEDELYDVKRGQWECRLANPPESEAHVLIFHSRMTSRIKNASDVIGIRPVGSKVGIFNGSRITYGTGWSEQKQPQQIAEDCGAVPIPFQNVVSKEEGAGLNLSKLKVIEWQGSENIVVPPINRNRQWSGAFYVAERHFAGAMLLQIEDKYFLFDTDREEVEYHGFNPFFTQLPSAASSLDEAYDLLMPDPVKEAILAKKDVIRQGEFFFVEADQDDVRQKLAGDEKRELDQFFYNQLVDRIKLVGANRVNCFNAYQDSEVVSFIQRCNEHNSRLLPQSKSQMNAERTLKPYRDRLLTKVGPEKAHSVPDSKDLNVHAFSNSNIPLEFIHEELENRLGGRWGTAEERRKRSADKFRIEYNMRIGANEGTTGRNNHEATAVYQAGTGEVYALGSVFHQGRQHRPVYLDKWYRVYANTATANWTVSGDVD